jgi:hypothetical protein
MVICPDSSGRRDLYNSWAVAGQLQDIAEIAGVVEASIPWVRIDHERLYLAGISMGGQETLCAIARYPDVFAAGLCVDGNANLAARYRELPLCDMKDTQPLMRKEVGGTPRRVPWLYARRSSTPFASTLATCGVPVSIWWSREDPIGINQAKTQTGYLYTRIMRLNPAAPVTQVIGTGGHGSMLFQHPEDVLAFLRPGGTWRTLPAAPASWDYRSWVTEAEAWGYRFTTTSPGRKLWRVHVAPGSLQVWSPKTFTASVPYAADTPGPVTVTVNGVPTQLLPVEGTLTVTLPAGASTATWPVL